MFEKSWAHCWKSIGAGGTGSELMEQLLGAYREPQRKYHTQQHLGECLSLLGEHIDCAIEPAEVEIALWFHDAIYDVKAFDNEARSAEWAVRELKKAGVDTDKISRVQAHILSTRHAAPPHGRDQQLLVDIDLSILGAGPNRFEEYEKQVRQEYSHVPGFLFRRKRRQILSELLARNPIYTTPVLRQKFEEQARRNISQSVSALGI